jgi:hypothetical protein
MLSQEKSNFALTPSFTDPQIILVFFIANEQIFTRKNFKLSTIDANSRAQREGNIKTMMPMVKID